MKIHVVTYSNPSFRLSCVHELLGRLTARGSRAQLVHPSIIAARNLSETIGVPVMSVHTLGYTPVDADCLVVIDGDIIGPQMAGKLSRLDKDAYFVVPADALPGTPEVTGTADLLKSVRTIEFGDKPATFGCHHMAETCRACEDLVINWKADIRDKQAVGDA